MNGTCLHGAVVAVLFEHVDLRWLQKSHDHLFFLPTDLCDVYTWGDNINLTLGHGKEQRRGHPEVIDEFRKKAIQVKEVRSSRSI